jgi:hypothetical protein
LHRAHRAAVGAGVDALLSIRAALR